MSPDLEISLIYTDFSSLIIPSYYYKGVTTHTVSFYWNWFVINNVLGCHIHILWVQNALGKSMKSLRVCFGSFVPKFIEHKDQLMPPNYLDNAWAKICDKVSNHRLNSENMHIEMLINYLILLIFSVPIYKRYYRKPNVFIWDDFKFVYSRLLDIEKEI